MENRRNYYRILHVQHDAPGEIINTSYRTLMQRLRMHPDLGGCHKQASLINEAYAILSDPLSRANYDDMYAQNNGGQDSVSNAQRPPSANKPFYEKKPVSGYCFYCLTPQPAIEITNEDDCAQCCSPLTMPDYSFTSASARRAIDRMPKSFPLNFYPGWPETNMQYGKVIDFSPGGMRFIADTPLDVGKVIAIDSELCSAVGKVNRRYHNEVAIQFLTLRFKTKQGVFVSVRA